MIQVELPISQEKIPETLKLLREDRARIEKELKMNGLLISAVQSCCEHPPSHKESGNTWGRWEYTACTLCGKEW